MKKQVFAWRVWRFWHVGRVRAEGTRNFIKKPCQKQLENAPNNEGRHNTLNTVKNKRIWNPSRSKIDLKSLRGASWAPGSPQVGAKGGLGGSWKLRGRLETVLGGPRGLQVPAGEAPPRYGRRAGEGNGRSRNDRNVTFCSSGAVGQSLRGWVGGFLGPPARPF